MPHGHHDHGGGHIPQSEFQDWGNWGWNYPQFETLTIQEPVPTWLWVAGGALAGMILALLSRGR